ncbi:hypothetical protein F8M41_007974 [Gigaspora margarita]|uniref:Uncharacterized protein n=1 Tax=Gigaspora margarita TaxID=4874 RepID=A0A8H4AVW5_GIGMA|nr:hypothetical protein F8M41_007974 [Gigaspora margarita]
MKRLNRTTSDDINVLVDYGMNLLDDKVPVDSEEFDITEILVNDVLEDSDKSNFTDDVLEDMTTEFEGFNSEYGPYFPNFTLAMIFVWITKHMISE